MRRQRSPYIGAVRGEAVVDRDGLIERARPARVCAIEAPGGFGKTTFALALAKRHELATVLVPVADGTDRAELLVLLTEALRQTGLADVAESMARTNEDSAATDLAAAVDARGEPVCLIIDDVHRLTAVAAELVAHLVQALPPACRAVVAGRHLPPAVREIAAAGATGADVAAIGPDDLRFDRETIRALLAAGASATAGDTDVDAASVLAGEIARTTAGWPLAVDLVVTQRRTLTLDPSTSPRPLSDIMTSLVAGLLADRPPADRDALAHLAAVPMLSADVAAALGEPDALHLAESVGLPLTRRSDGWFALPDPVREAFGEAALGATKRRAVAAVYAGAGELVAAVHLLASAGDHEGVGLIIGDRPWTELEAAGVPFVRVVAAHAGTPWTASSITLLVTLARAAEHDDPTLRSALLAAAEQETIRLDGAADAVLRRRLAAELAYDAARRGDLEACDRLVTQALAGDAGELDTRARALLASGIADTIRVTPAALARARNALRESAALAELDGQLRWSASALVRLGYGVLFHGGDIEGAIEPIEHALALAPAADAARALTLTYLSDVLDHAGRVAEAEAACREALAIGHRLRDHRVIGYACWSRAWVAAHANDHAATVAWLGEALAHPGPWLEQANGAEFYLAAADMLLALGDEAGGAAYLEIARARTHELGLPDALAPVLGRWQAMFGDAEEAETLLAASDGRPFATRLGRWNVALLRAFAAHRRGDVEAAARHRADALAMAAELGCPDLPRRHDRWLDDRLAPYDQADPASSSPSPSPSPLSLELRMLGGFSLFEEGADRTPAPGNPATLVKLLALHGSMTADEVLDRLWPDADVSTARSRLRNTLNRLRSRSGEVVERRAELLELSASVVSDVAGFERAAAEALAAPRHRRAGLARRAVARYAGDLLPGDRYEDWAAGPRERLRRRYLSLVDLLAADAEERGDLDEAIRQLDVAIACEPLDDSRPTHAARLLLSQGRRASARDVVGQALAVVDGLGVEATPELRRLADELGV